jgi:hypothetical protein
MGIVNRCSPTAVIIYSILAAWLLFEEDFNKQSLLFLIALPAITYSFQSENKNNKWIYRCGSGWFD